MNLKNLRRLVEETRDLQESTPVVIRGFDHSYIDAVANVTTAICSKDWNLSEDFELKNRVLGEKTEQGIRIQVIVVE